MARVLLLASKLSYRIDDFVAAASRLGIELKVALDRCHVLGEQWRFDSLRIELDDLELAVQQIAAEFSSQQFDALIPTDDATAELAARAAQAVGIGGNSIAATENARNKKKMRTVLASAQVRVPGFSVFAATSAPSEVAAQVRYPCVMKPLLASASRGVMRADNQAECVERWARLQSLFKGDEEFLVEEFVAGSEVAVEAILQAGKLVPLALFDKPDPLDGPFFEETLYVTPSRHGAELQAAVFSQTAAAAAALGLRHGPVHAELRLGAAGPTVIEVAARSIGGLCSRTLRFGLGGRSLEEIVLKNALGQALGEHRLDGASGVMMIPIPKAGVLKSVAGVEAARAVPGVESIEITTQFGEVLLPLPEGASYLGFIFARGDGPQFVETALRKAHHKMTFEVLPTLSLTGNRPR